MSALQFFSVFAGVGFLWFRLIDHLRIEWTVNPQYGYGWVVPFLCGYLLWRRRGWGSTGGSTPYVVAYGEGGFGISMFWVLGLALLYLPTRLVQEANPEWRLVSWALAVEVIVLTAWLLWAGLNGVQRAVVLASAPESLGEESQVKGLARRLQRSGLGSPLGFVWPLAFFLTAVPWPTVVEGPLVQVLTRANTAVTVELVDLFGVPALQHGNAIEVGAGMVGIDEACSGIRSFQVTLMLGLFFGELYGLSLLRRAGLCAAGFGFSFLFNVARTTLLTWIAGTKGAAAMRGWHDPAGAAILVGCFGCIWLMARWWRVTRAQAVGGGASSTGQGPSLSGICTGSPGANALGFKLARLEALGDRLVTSSPTGDRLVTSSPTGVFLLAWIVACELGTEGWYRYHEGKLPAAVTWEIQPPVGNPSLRQVTFSEKTRQFLRYDEAVNVAWEEREKHFQAIFLRWKPGRTAVHLAKTHTPEACVTAVGHRLASKSDVRLCSVAGLELPFRAYVFETSQGPLHVYYCLWEDRAPDRAFDAASLTYGNRLEPVLAGRRLSGQRSLELAIWGCADPEAADAAMREELGRIVHSPQSTVHGPKSEAQSPKFKVQSRLGSLLAI